MNQVIYEKTNIVERYTTQSHLQYPETLILEQLKSILPKEAVMLDLGVGGGRTTVHFAPLVKKYIGIDFSSAMINACQKRFGTQMPEAKFEQGDARDLSRFEDNSFDFILFSYNGIDYVNHADRLIVLKEIHRVLKPNGWFSFSAHNIQSFGRTNVVSGLKNKLVQSVLNMILYAINGDFGTQRQKKYAVLRDTGELFRLQTYYIAPNYQKEQLKAIGFDNISTYGLNQKQSSEQDTWVYFLTQKMS